MTIAALVGPRTAHVGIPLFVHVLGAMLLVGTVLVVASALALGWRRADDGEATALTRWGLLTVFYGVLPAYIVMRVGAQWTESAENFPKDYSATWLDIGYLVADISAALVVVCLILSGLGLRALRRGGGLRLARSVGVITALMLVGYVIAVWAMAGKPT